MLFCNIYAFAYNYYIYFIKHHQIFRLKAYAQFWYIVRYVKSGICCVIITIIFIHGNANNIYILKNVIAYYIIILYTVACFIPKFHIIFYMMLPFYIPTADYLAWSNILIYILFYYLFYYLPFFTTCFILFFFLLFLPFRR
jgi:hypothetical protein